MIVLLRIIRGVIGFLFAIALLGVIDALVAFIRFFINQQGFEAGVVIVIFLTKLVFSIILGLIFFGMRLLINKIYIRKTKQNIPILQKKWSL